MDYAVRGLNALLMMALPVGLGMVIAERLKVTWRLFAVGAVTFVASQVVHLPLNYGLTALFNAGILPGPPAEWTLPFNATVLGLTSGLSEEIARYLVYLRWIKTARSWREALMFGAGHGGIEAIIFGALGGVTLLQMVVLRNGDLSAIPEVQRALAAQQIADYWAAPWYAALLGAVERVFALCVHLAMATTVLQAVVRKNLWWLAAAIWWHAAANGVTVFVVGTRGIYWAEATVGVFALGSLGVIFALRPRSV